MDYNVPSKVLLPTWVFELGEDDKHTMELAISYVKPRYKNYVIERLEKPFAICTKPWG